MSTKPSLRRNVIALFLLQGCNYIFPLLTIPWLTRALGPDGFGRIGFATAFCMYFSLLSDYGFNLSATRQIAIQRDDRAACSRIFWSTFATKVILAAAGFLVLVAATYLVPRLAEERSLLAVGYLAVAGTVLTPIWYFQGIERMTVLTTVNLAARSATLPLIFLLVDGKEDVWLAMLITSATGLVAGCLSMAALARLRHLQWHRPSLDDIRRSLEEGWHLFVSTAGVSLYTTSNTVILGFVAGSTEVGYFTAAQRLVKAIQAMISPLGQAVYPRISHLMHNSREEAFALIRKVLGLQGWVTLAVSLTLLAGAELAVQMVFGPSYRPAVNVLRWLAPLPFLVGLSNVFGIQTMLPLGHKKAFSRILLGSGVVNVSVIVPLGIWYGATGASAAVCLTEFLVTAAMIFYLNRRAVPVFGCAKVTTSE